MADDVGRVLVVSCSSLLTALETIKRINGSEDLPKPEETTPHMDCYPWMINNKYFSVVIYLCHGKSSDYNQLLMKTSHLHFEAIIIIFDQEKKESLESANDCMRVLLAHNSSVRLLVNAGKDVMSTSSLGLSKGEILEWCLKYSFELVELNPNDDEEEAGEFGAQAGFPRVVQALNCGEWPNIELKSGIKKGKMHSKALVDEISKTDDMKSCAQSNHIQERGQTSQIDGKTSAIELTGCPAATDDTPEILQQLDRDKTEEESFEDLFMKLRDMKDHAASLPHEERKSYAEQVAIAFWKAMGGDDDEISGLDEDLN